MTSCLSNLNYLVKLTAKCQVFSELWIQNYAKALGFVSQGFIDTLHKSKNWKSSKSTWKLGLCSSDQWTVVQSVTVQCGVFFSYLWLSNLKIIFFFCAKMMQML